MAQIRAYLSIGLAGCKREEIIDIDDSELEGLSDAERELHFEAYARDWKDEKVEWGFEPLETNT